MLMSKLMRVYGTVGGMCFLLLSVSPVKANPFDALNRAINGVNSTIHNTRGTVDATHGTVNSLRNLLGTSGGSAGSTRRESGGDEELDMAEVFDLYQGWYVGLPVTDREIVAWLVTEHASGSSTSFEDISSSDWFKEKPLQQQQRVGELFFKFGAIVEAVGDQRDSFLGYAFCVNGGSQNCAQ
jgi:hypothetical protein